LKHTRYESDKHLRDILLTELEKDFEKTKGLDPKPRLLVFASTFKNDSHLQQKALSLSADSTIVEYWGSLERSN